MGGAGNGGPEAVEVVAPKAFACGVCAFLNGGQSRALASMAHVVGSERKQYSLAKCCVRMCVRENHPCWCKKEWPWAVARKGRSLQIGPWHGGDFHPSQMLGPEFGSAWGSKCPWMLLKIYF